MSGKTMERKLQAMETRIVLVVLIVGIVLADGWKAWLLAGLLALSFVAGFVSLAIMIRYGKETP